MTITFHDAGPDERGRRRFTLDWYNSGGVFIPEPGVAREGPVGFYRGQVFNSTQWRAFSAEGSI